MLRPTTDGAHQATHGLLARLSGALTARRMLLLLVLAGLALRLWLIQVSPLDPRFSNADDGDYYRRALRLAVTGQYIDDAWLIRPPLHVFFFALWLRLALLIGQPQLGVLLVQLAQVAVGLATIPLGYGIARRLFASQVAGLLFAGFLAVWFPFVEQPTVLFSELLYGCLFLLHLWLLLRFDTSGRRRELALAGLALGAAALTRSPALYALAFVVLWLGVRALGQRATYPAPRPPIAWRELLLNMLVVVACCLAVVGPWTLRNYLVYGHLIPVDTLGQINLWLDLDRVSLRNEHIETLRQLPQSERHIYALERAREILVADPWRPFRSIWPTFQHIWKAQYVEDFFVKQSFFSRTLRASAGLGLLGDLLWLVFTLGGVIGLAAPAREGLHNRLLLLAWVGYSLVTVLLFHVEPRYLVPLWTLIALYGAWVLASLLGERARIWRGRPANLILAAAVALAVVALVASYRDYPAFIGRGLARERAIVAGERAYAAADYRGAEQAFRAALAAQPNFVDAQVSLALALAAQGRTDTALAELQPGSSRQADLVRGALQRDAGDLAGADRQLTRVEAIAGEDVQRWTLRWLRPPPTDQLALGSGLALGYIAGFSAAESDPRGSFRWLEGSGRIELPLPTPLPPTATVVLRVAGGPLPSTPLTVRINDGPPLRFHVAGGGWRQYHLPIPPAAYGQTRLVVTLDAPTFVPARLDPASSDARALSLMVGGLTVR